LFLTSLISHFTLFKFPVCQLKIANCLHYSSSIILGQLFISKNIGNYWQQLHKILGVWSEEFVLVQQQNADIGSSACHCFGVAI
jgi:hypothetical protein